MTFQLIYENQCFDKYTNWTRSQGSLIQMSKPGVKKQTWQILLDHWSKLFHENTCTVNCSDITRWQCPFKWCQDSLRCLEQIPLTSPASSLRPRAGATEESETEIKLHFNDFTASKEFKLGNAACATRPSSSAPESVDICLCDASKNQSQRTFGFWKPEIDDSSDAQWAESILLIVSN